MEIWEEEGSDATQKILSNQNLVNDLTYCVLYKDFKDIIYLLKDQLQDFFDKESVINKTSDCMIHFATSLCPEVKYLSEQQKEEIFKNDGRKTVGILLYEFATGTGETLRKFTYQKGKGASFVNQYLKGWVIEDLYKQIYLKFDKEHCSGNIGIGFSPDDVSLSDFIYRHEASNICQFFVGGAIATIIPSDEKNMVIVIIKNTTGKKSLFLHLANDTETIGSKLSNKNQIIIFKLRLDESKFK